VNDKEFLPCLAPQVESMRQFAQMLNDILAALPPAPMTDEKPTEDNLSVQARVPVNMIVRDYSTKIKDRNVFFAPEIPSGKLRNAVKAFAPGFAEKDVLVLVDDTIFGSAKKGALLTEDTLYVQNQLAKPQSIALADIHGVTLTLDDRTTLSVDDPEFRSTITLDEESMRQFAQMLHDMKAALHPAPMIGEKSTDDGLSVTLVPRVQRPKLIRMVPIVDGKLRRFSFMSVSPQEGEFGKLENPRAGFFSHPKVTFELRGGKVIAKTTGKDVFVNDEPLLTERELADEDRITLGKGQFRDEYQFQADPQLAKSKRREDETAQGIIRQPPDFSSEDKPIRKLREQLSITAEGVCLEKQEGGKRLRWSELGAVQFSPDLGRVTDASNMLDAAADGT